MEMPIDKGKKVNHYKSSIRKAWKDLFLRKLSSEEEVSIENENLRIVSAISMQIAVLEVLFFFGFLIYYRSDLKSHVQPIVSVAACAGICFLIHLTALKLVRTGADRKKIRLMITCAYWIVCLWGMAGSVRHYREGTQMIIFDTVQICFALLLYIPPVRAVLRVVCSYSVQLYILWQIDRAAGISIVNYYMMALVILIGYLVRYLQKKRSLHQNERIIEKNAGLSFDSTHDGLTGMKNRMALRKDFPDYIGKHLYVVMTDVDKFKQYNDWFGHEVGDRVLSGVGKQTLDLFGYDSVYRYGGDEFLLILESRFYENIQELLLVWEQDISKLQIEGLDSAHKIRCSYGAVQGFPKTNEMLRNMILEADSRMYKMKRGRST